MIHRVVLSGLLLVGCPKSSPTTGPVPAPPMLGRPAPPSLLEVAQARVAPDALRGRFSFKVASDVLGISGSTGGALLFDRPGRGHLAVLGPLGGPLVTVQTDGTGLAVAVTRGRQHFVSEDGEALIREATAGAAGIEAVLGLMVGEIPMAGLEVVAEERLEDGGLQVELAGPQETRIIVVLAAPDGSPRTVEVSKGTTERLLSATYAPFEANDTGDLLPTEVDLEVPALALTLDLKFKSWDLLDPVPEVFGMATPDGYTSRPLEGLALNLPDADADADPEAPE